MAASNTDLSDASSIFNVQDQQVLQLEVLFSEEMKETEGAWFTYALGGLAGMYGSGYGFWLVVLQGCGLQSAEFVRR
jgi:hypothetical protein